MVGRASRSGRTSPRRVRSSRATISRICRPTSASTTCVYPRRARRRPSWLGSTASRRSATGTTGSLGDASSSGLRRGARIRPARLLLLPRLGEPDVDRHLVRRGRSPADRADVSRRRGRPRHFEHVLPAFRDERYLRVDGRPVFYLFRPELHPEPAAFVDRWQGMAAEAGLGSLYLVAEVSDLLGKGPKYASLAVTASMRVSTSGYPPWSNTHSSTAHALRPEGAALAGALRVRAVTRSAPASLRSDTRSSVRLSELGQHSSFRPAGPRPDRIVAGSFSPSCSCRGRLARASFGGASPPVHQVLERVGGGQLPRARPRPRTRVPGGPGRRNGRAETHRELATMRPLRIAMVSYYMPSESKLGTGHQVHALANALVDRGHDVTVFTRCQPLSRRALRHARPSGWKVRCARSSLRGGFARWIGPLRRPSRPQRRLPSLRAAVRPPHSHAPRQLTEGSDPYSRPAAQSRDALLRGLLRGHASRGRRLLSRGLVAIRRPGCPGCGLGFQTGWTSRFTPGREIRASERFIRRHVPPSEAGPAPRRSLRASSAPRLPDAELWLVSEDAPDRPGAEGSSRVSPRLTFRSSIAALGCSASQAPMKDSEFPTSRLWPRALRWSLRASRVRSRSPRMVATALGRGR